MTTQWGAWEYSGGNGMRVGVNVSVSAVTSASANVTFTYSVYTENQYNYSDSQTITYGGNSSGSTAISNTSSGGAVLRATKTYTYTYSTYGTSPGSTTFTAAVSGTYNGVTPSVSRATTIPARPSPGPNPPSAVVNVRNSDTQATVTWTRNATPAYTSQTVAMRTYTGAAWSSWSYSVVVSATATSYVKTGLSANHAYQFEVRANNSAGSSAYVAAPTYVYMTPAPPTGVASVINTAGTQITTTWTNAHYVEGNNKLTVERSVNGAAYTVVASGLAHTTTSWTDTAPGVGSNAYRVKVVQTVGTLASAYTVGNTVSTVVAPSAPTALSPNGVAADLAGSVTLRWTHNPGADSALQSHFTIEYSSNGGSSWAALATNVASSVAEYVITAGTLANGATYLWRVKTQGSTLAAFGVMSASATIIGSAIPTATITLPGATIVSLPLVVTWDYNQDQASPETMWWATLKTGDGTVGLEFLSGTNALETATFAYPIVDGTAYRIEVQVRSGAGLSSAVTTLSTTVVLPTPAPLTIMPEYQASTGTTILHLEAIAPVGAEVAAVTAIVERRLPGGDWLVLYPSVPLPNDVLDLLPMTRGSTEYRITSVSALPSYFVNTIVVVTPEDPLFSPLEGAIQWVLVNYGTAFDQLVRFRGNPEVQESADRVKDTRSLLGRRKPVLLLGEGRDHGVSVSGSLVHDVTGFALGDFDSPPADWITAGLEAELVCYRDFTGRRMFGALFGVQATDEFPGYGAVSFQVTESDYNEQYGSSV